MAMLFGGGAAWCWWIVIRIVIYGATKEQAMIGACSSARVFVGTYFVEYLLLGHGWGELR